MSAVKQRVALWDNAKFLVLVTVVIGHTIEGIRMDGTVAFAVYSLFYLFHMPTMIFISGYFSRAELDRKAIASMFQLAAIYVIWESIFAVIRFALDGKKLPDDWLVDSSWGMWYLVALVLLRLALPFIVATKWPLTVSIFLALASTLLPDIDSYLSLARTLQFLPFFIVGYIAKERGWLDRSWFSQPSKWFMLLGGGVVAAAGALMLVVPSVFEGWRIFNWFMLRDSMEDLLDPESAVFPPFLSDLAADGGGSTLLIAGLALKILMMVAAAVVGLAFLMAVPRRHSWITGLGANSLNIYLLHLAILAYVRSLDVIDSFYLENGLLGLASLIACAVVVSIVLGTKLVARIVRPITAPNVKWLLKSTPTSRTVSSGR